MTAAVAERLVYVEIDVDYCSLTYGTAPCTAAIPTTGTIKCFNTRATCQDAEHFTNSPVTLRFAEDSDYRPLDIAAIASIESVSYSPAVISLGEDLGQRASVSVTFRDHPYADTGPGGDKYLGDRTYDPFRQGTFWGKFRTRQKYLRGRPLRLIYGKVGQSLAEMETHHFIVESVDGPTLDGRFTVTGKDTLKLADDDQAQAPALSPGYLNADIDAAVTFATLSPSGVGADYPASGYLNLGGKEIVGFARDTGLGNDADCILLLHGDGSDGATTITDSSASARTATAVGNAQVDTAKAVFGTASLLFDGTGDCFSFPDSADWTFAGDFTIEARAWFSTLGAIRPIASHSTDANNQYRFYATSAGALVFDIKNGGTTNLSVASANGTVVTGQWYHLAVVRNGGTVTIYKDGVSVASAGYGGSITNYSSVFRVGGDGGFANSFAGWLDEVRVSKVARWTTTFTPPATPYSSTGDELTLTRAQLGTEAAAHSGGDRAQLCLMYTAEDPADVIADLFESYATIDAAVIPLADWQAETAAYYRRQVTACIAEPTPVRQLVSELILQCGLAIWWDTVAQKVRLQVLRAIDTAAAVFDDAVIVEGSLSVKEQPEKRISRVWTFFGLRSPLEPLDEPTSYRSSVLTADLEAEGNWGQPAIKKIFSRWIPFGGLTIAERVNDIQLGRFVDPPRRFTFAVFSEHSETPALGNGRRLKGRPMQDETGAQAEVPVQHVSVGLPEAGRRQVTSEEQLFVTLDEEDLSAHPITIDANVYDVDLRALYDALYPTPVAGDEVNVTINSGVIVGSTSTATPALTVGSWPQASVTGNRTSGSAVIGGIADTTGLTAGMFVRGTGIPDHAKILSVDSGTQITLDANATSGSGTSTTLTVDTVIINLSLNGRIEGRGGDGRSQDSTVVGQTRSGKRGGDALQAHYGINLTAGASAELWGGGGGGGSPIYFSYPPVGGGGAGSLPGAAGTVANDPGGVAAANGTTSTGGQGGVVTAGTFEGGDGGGPGLSGGAATSSSAYAQPGGPPGLAIDGEDLVKIAGSPDVRGDTARMPLSASISASQTDHSESSSNGSSYSFSTLSIGAVAEDRIVYVGLAQTCGSALRTVTGVTLGGNAMTRVAHAEQTGTGDPGAAEIWAIDAGSGMALAAATTATVAVSLSGSTDRCGVSVVRRTGGYREQALTAITPGGVGGSAPQTRVDKVAGGMTLAVASQGADPSPGSVSWTGVSEVLDTAIETDRRFSVALSTTSIAEAEALIKATFSSPVSFTQMVAASFR